MCWSELRKRKIQTKEHEETFYKKGGALHSLLFPIFKQAFIHSRPQPPILLSQKNSGALLWELKISKGISNLKCGNINFKMDANNKGCKT
jgi:hypothetical protein